MCAKQEQRKDAEGRTKGVLRLSIVVPGGKLKGWVRNSDRQGPMFEPVAASP